MLDSVNRGIDSAAKFTNPALAPGCSVHSVNLGVRTSEEHDSVGDDRRGPNFSFRRRFPKLISDMSIKCIHFAVVAPEKQSIPGERRGGMDLPRRLKFPLGCTCADVNGVNYSAYRRDIQNAVLKDRRGTHRAASVKLPNSAFGRPRGLLPLSSATSVVFEQRGPVQGFIFGCFRHHLLRPRGHGDLSA